MPAPQKKFHEYDDVLLHGEGTNKPLGIIYDSTQPPFGGMKPTMDVSEWDAQQKTDDHFRTFVRWIIAIVLVCILACAAKYANGQDKDVVPARQPKASITDPNGQPLPEEMPLGEMVVFSFKQSVYGGKPESIKVIIEPAERRVRSFFSDDMLTAYVPTGIKPVIIKCTLIVAKQDVPDYMTVSVKCGGAIPAPDPAPDPNPPKPDPDKPPTAFRAKLIALNSAYTFKSEDKTKVANAFRRVAKDINSITDTKDLLRRTAEGMSVEIGLNPLLTWIPWRDKLIELIAELKLPDIKSHAAVWETIADTLEGKP